MVDESDADRILRERERRRSLERNRIEDARRAREVELDRLEAFERRAGPSGGAGRRPRVVLRPVPEAEGESSEPDLDRNGQEGTSRNVGGAVVPPAVGRFLETDPTEGFDLQRLNSIRLSGLIESVGADAVLLSSLAARAEALMQRIKQELDDPLSAGALLRDLARRWYRESPSDPEWISRMPEQWGGLFADSRISGGRLQPWINRRLYTLRTLAVRSGPLRRRIARGLGRDRGADLALLRTPAQQIHGEVAQAILDDLAGHPRTGDAPVPLVRLSELAVRRQLTTINDSLALLFHAPETGPFVVLHPNRYPDCDELVLKPPTAGANGAAMAYSLVSGRYARKGAGRGKGSGSGESEPSGSTDEGDSRAEKGEIDPAAIWDADPVPLAAWKGLLETVHRERRRLDAPPKDYRGRPAYTTLRELLLSDGAARRTFVAVRWRGRPAGLPILVQLLQKGSLAPEVSTDHEYLEAELGELAQGDPSWNPPDGRWSMPGWTVVREGGHKDGFRFRAEPTSDRTPRPA